MVWQSFYPNPSPEDVASAVLLLVTFVLLVVGSGPNFSQAQRRILEMALAGEHEKKTARCPFVFCLHFALAQHIPTFCRQEIYAKFAVEITPKKMAGKMQNQKWVYVARRRFCVLPWHNIYPLFNIPTFCPEIGAEIRAGTGWKLRKFVPCR